MTGVGGTVYTVGGVFGGLFVTDSLENNGQTVRRIAGICRRIDNAVAQKTAAGRIFEANTAAVKSTLKVKDAAVEATRNVLGCVRFWRSKDSTTTKP